MSIWLIIAIAWLAFDLLVYLYLWYDLHAVTLDLAGKWQKLLESLTEE